MSVEKVGYSLGPLLSMREILLCANMADQQESVNSIMGSRILGQGIICNPRGHVPNHQKEYRLGTSIVSIYSRTPATVAMAATTLDMLSDNRTIIGLGASTGSYC